MRPTVALMSDEALRQRRDELLYALGVAEHKLLRVTDALHAREPNGKVLPPNVHHGNRDGYRYGCHCTACCQANADYQADARRRAAEFAATKKIKPKRRTAMHPKITRPRVELQPGPDGMQYAMCRHCTWQEGPSGKTYMMERAAAHRQDHRTGRVPVTTTPAATR